jgi:hypothetical protein
LRHLDAEELGRQRRLLRDDAQRSQERICGSGDRLGGPFAARHHEPQPVREHMAALRGERNDLRPVLSAGKKQRIHQLAALQRGQRQQGGVAGTHVPANLPLQQQRGDFHKCEWSSGAGSPRMGNNDDPNRTIL